MNPNFCLVCGMRGVSDQLLKDIGSLSPSSDMSHSRTELRHCAGKHGANRTCKANAADGTPGW